MKGLDVEIILYEGRMSKGGHSTEIRRQSFKPEVHRNVLSQGVVNVWNVVHWRIVELKSLEAFNEEVDVF